MSTDGIDKLEVLGGCLLTVEVSWMYLVDVY